MKDLGLKEVIAWGLGRAWRAPRLIIGLWLLNVLAALPAALLMSAVLGQSIGSSRFHEGMTQGFDSDWYAEFRIEEEGLAQTFRTTIIGGSAVLTNLDNWWSGRILFTHPGLVALGLAYAVLWAFLLGGVLEVLRRPEGPRSYAGFTTACGATFRPFLVLVLFSLLAYGMVFRFSAWAFGKLSDATRDATEEGPLFWKSVAIAALIVLLLHVVRMIFDYAKIAVVTRESGAFRSFLEALSFVATRPLPAFAAYAMPTLLVLVVTAIYAFLAPGAGQSTGLTAFLAFLAGQIYLVAKIGLRIAVLGSQLRYYRSF